MGFGLIAVIVVGVFVWQLLSVNQKTKVAYKQKRKAIPQSAKEILDERYANDELTREEYLAVLEDLEAHQQYK